MKTWQSFLNLTLRGLSMGARFLLVFYLGKYFSIETLGSYGIFYTTVTLALFILGLDFYTFSNREVLFAQEKDRLSLLRNQLVFYGIIYVVFLPPMVLIFLYDVLPFQYICFFYLILVFEHLSQEFYRIFTILSLPIFANWLLFLRNGIWIYLLLMIWVIMPSDYHSLNAVWWGWLLGAGVSVVAGFVEIIALYKKYSLAPIKFTWIKSGIKVCMYYFGATIALKIIEFSNRYIIEYWCSIKAVGIFTFYSQIANMINVIIFTLFIMVIYPKLMLAVNANNGDELKSIKTDMMRKILIYSLLLGVLLIIIIKPALYFINKNDFYSEINTFYILIISNIVLNVSFVYHYILYALKKDISIFVATLMGAVFSVVLNIILIKFFGILGAAIATLVSYAVVGFFKAFYSKKTVTAFNI